MPAFNVELMFNSAQKAIEDFAAEHKNETFYAFSIDGNMLCLNSLEKFEAPLKHYLHNHPEHYTDQAEIEELKYNTGDWEYQGFYCLEDGFSEDLYNEHYNIPFDNKSLNQEELAEMFSKTSYHKAMNELLQKLHNYQVFNVLNRSRDFKVFLSEHNY